jgi:hypothetical protein
VAWVWVAWECNPYLYYCKFISKPLSIEALLFLMLRYVYGKDLAQKLSKKCIVNNWQLKI